MECYSPINLMAFLTSKSDWLLSSVSISRQERYKLLTIDSTEYEGADVGSIDMKRFNSFSSKRKQKEDYN